MLVNGSTVHEPVKDFNPSGELMTGNPRGKAHPSNPNPELHLEYEAATATAAAAAAAKTTTNWPVLRTDRHILSLFFTAFRSSGAYFTFLLGRGDIVAHGRDLNVSGH